MVPDQFPFSPAAGKGNLICFGFLRSHAKSQNKEKTTTLAAGEKRKPEEYRKSMAK